MTKHYFLVPVAEKQQNKIIAREILELASILSVEQKDFVSFERNVAQLKAYYSEE